MSTAHRRSTSSSTTVEAGSVPAAAVATKLSGQEAGSRAHERRRTRQRGITRRPVDHSAGLEARLAQERERLAADVHDLIMQDVAFALARARAIAAEPELVARHAQEAVAAGERALAGARAILSGLAGSEQRPIVEALEESVRVAVRGVALSFESAVVEGLRADKETADALVHIAREAATNAVKHAAPEHVSVTLSHDDEWRLRVSDDGCGFAPGAVARGFGLESIATRARALGGSLSVDSAPGEGTVIEVSLP